MDKNLEAVCIALEDLSKAVLASWNDDRTMTEHWGWNFPPVTRQDIAAIPANLASKVRAISLESVNPSIQKILPPIVTRINLLKAQTIPYLFNGNGNQAVPAFMASMNSIANWLDPLFSWERLVETKAMPKQISTRLRGLRAEIDQIVVDRDSLISEVSAIHSGADAAESLPADLASLEAARNKIAGVEKDSNKAIASIAGLQADAVAKLQDIRRAAEEADQLVERCEAAYKITTTVGLAASFDQRRSRTAWSMWVWVAGLLAALVLGAWQGAHRLELLAKIISTPGASGAAFAAQLVTAFISVGAPMWFAWIATKQIGQRFRLAEDYAYKAAVAKAYEGYRKEAVRIDPEFEKRLFASALTRLEEAPLRLVETETHGSPWHELLNSPALKAALKTAPEFRQQFLDLINQVMKNEFNSEKTIKEAKPVPKVGATAE